MDTSVSEIEFDSLGVCGFCRGVRGHIGRTWFPDSSGSEKMDEMFEAIRLEGRVSKHDSILGLSGGIDSAVVAKRAIERGLRPLAVHVDGGWNTRESILNVKNLVKHLGLELRTIVIDWEDMRALQLAFLKSGTLNQDIPQDHAFFTSLYRLAHKEGIPHVLSGVNYATESVEPTSWGSTYLDGAFIKSIFRSEGKGSLRNFPVMSLIEYQNLKRRNRFKVFEPLNFGVYDPDKELHSLKSEFGWQEYQHKHGESIFTSWFQETYLPDRYGINKLRAHYSSRIISGLMKRSEALARLSSNAGPSSRLDSLVSQKLRISVDELKNLKNLEHVDDVMYKGFFANLRRLAASIKL